jgi:hypothetical protein
MGLIDWWKRKKSFEHPGLVEWRRQWRAACAEPDASAAAPLGEALTRLGLPEEEIEIEREMLDGLERLVHLRAAAHSAELPVLETGHRVVGRDLCHFSVPSSMPDEQSQPAGRLIFTNARAIFTGGPNAITIAWHTVADVLDEQRDIVLVTHGRALCLRFRCNVFADALAGAFLARVLAARHCRGAS